MGPASRDKILLVPCGYDGEAAGAVLSRVFATHLLFVPLEDPVGTNRIVKAVSESGKIPITAGLRILDDSFYGDEGVSIESTSSQNSTHRSKWEGLRRVAVPSKTLSEAVLKLFNEKLTEGEKALLSAAMNLNLWLTGKRLPAPALEDALFLAAARDLSPESVYPFMERFPKGAGESCRATGWEAAVLRHLAYQLKLSDRVSQKILEFPAPGRTVSEVLVARGPRGATELCARLFLLQGREGQESSSPPRLPALFSLPRKGKTVPRRFFIRIMGGPEADFIKHGVELVRSNRREAVREAIFPKSRSISFIAGLVAGIEVSVREKERHTVAAEFGGMDKGI